MKKNSTRTRISFELNAKIDDGSPMRRNILDLKNKETYSITAAEQLANYCSDQTSTNIENVIYNSNIDLQYGCNIIKVMEDVK